jgi:uncharacterized protein YwbE
MLQKLLHPVPSAACIIHTRTPERVHKLPSLFKFDRLIHPTCLALLMLLQPPSMAAPNFDSAEMLKAKAQKSQTLPTDLMQNDLSGQFSYALPSGWSATKNPFHPHDLLVRKSNDGKKGSILLDISANHGNLEEQAKNLAADQEKNLENFNLVLNEKTTLSSGKTIARVICNGKVGDDEISQISYLMPFGRGKTLLIVETVAKDDQKYGLGIIESLATSVQFKKQKKGLLNL